MSELGDQRIQRTFGLIVQTQSEDRLWLWWSSRRQKQSWWDLLSRQNFTSLRNSSLYVPYTSLCFVQWSQSGCPEGGRSVKLPMIGLGLGPGGSGRPRPLSLASGKSEMNRYTATHTSVMSSKAYPDIVVHSKDRTTSGDAMGCNGV